MNYAWRLGELRKRLARERQLPMLITTMSNIFYLTGFLGSLAFLLISDEKEKPLFFCDGRYVSQAQEETNGRVDLILYERKPLEKIRDLVRARGHQALYIEDALSVSAYQNLNKAEYETIAIASPVNSLRMIKSPEETRTMERALAISEEAFRKIRCLIQEGISERSLALELDYQLLLLGADNTAFPTIVASGERAACPHARPSSRTLRKGDPVIFDWGARVDGYCADITRTVIVGTGPSPFRETLRTLREAQRTLEKTLQAGMSGKDADLLCRKELDKTGLGQYFTHGLGHGVGIDVHEEPRLNQDSDTVLAAGMVVTVEPGVYLPGQGGARIENLVLIGTGESRVLNKLSAIW
ncbi:MAG TPA: Xaa-Pro peptidase family protein [Atribacteraceae bacterium]|nr:Xaa-Pro peptidase family protein [Atribacteraceae bacterium]